MQPLLQCADVTLRRSNGWILPGKPLPFTCDGAGVVYGVVHGAIHDAIEDSVGRVRCGTWTWVMWESLVSLGDSCSGLHGVSLHYCKPCSTDQEGQLRRFLCGCTAGK